MERIPVTIAVLGLLYCKTDVTVGQDLKKGLNLIDLSLLPLTPILGSGSVSCCLCILYTFICLVGHVYVNASNRTLTTIIISLFTYVRVYVLQALLQPQEVSDASDRLAFLVCAMQAILCLYIDTLRYVVIDTHLLYVHT